MGGYVPVMSHDSDERVDRRAADLLPEELAVGSDDAEAQARAILDDSDLREADVEAGSDSFVERRTSSQTVTPPAEHR